MKRVIGILDKQTKGWRLLRTGLAILLVMLTVFNVGVREISPDKGSLTLGVGQDQKVITIGTEAEAAGSVDYTFGAANANVQFTAAIAALPATGGRLVVVSAVQINWAALTTVNVPANVIIEGSGYGTSFVGDGISPEFTATGNNVVFTNCRFDVAPSMGATTGWMQTNVQSGATYYAYRSPYGQSAFGAVAATSVTDSGLTPGGVAIAGAGGLLTTDTDLTFAVDTTTMTKATVTALTAPTGRSSTYVIAAPAAPTIWKSQADATLTGPNQLHTAIAAATALGYLDIQLSPGLFLDSGITTVNGMHLIGTGPALGNYDAGIGTIIALSSNATLISSSSSPLEFDNILFNGNGFTGKLFDFVNASHVIYNYCQFYQGIPATYALGTWHMRYNNCRWSLSGNAIVPQITVSYDVPHAWNCSDWWFESPLIEPLNGNFLYSDNANNNGFHFVDAKLECTTPNNYSLVTGTMLALQMRGGNFARANSVINATLSGSSITGGMYGDSVATDLVIDGRYNTVANNNFQNWAVATGQHITLAAGATNNQILNNVADDNPALGIVMILDSSTAKSSIIRGNQNTPPYPQISQTSLLSNGNFETGDPPTGWTPTVNVVLSQNGTVVVGGGYSMQITGSGADAWGDAHQAIADYLYYRGKWVAVQFQLYNPSTNTHAVRLSLKDGVSTDTEVVIPADDAWHLIQAEKLVSATATTLSLNFVGNYAGTNADFTIYVDRAGMIAGRLIDLPDVGANIVGP